VDISEKDQTLNFLGRVERFKLTEGETVRKNVSRDPIMHIQETTKSRPHSTALNTSMVWYGKGAKVNISTGWDCLCCTHLLLPLQTAFHHYFQMLLYCPIPALAALPYPSMPPHSPNLLVCPIMLCQQCLYPKTYGFYGQLSGQKVLNCMCLADTENSLSLLEIL
jgi:hypothetical protein